MAFARATVIMCSLVIWFSRKSRSWMLLFGSLLDHFVSSFDRPNGLWYFSKRFWSMGSMDQGHVFCLLISDNPGSRFMLELNLLLCRFWVLNALLDLSFFAFLMTVQTILLFFRDFFRRSGLLECWIRSYVRGHWFGCLSEVLVWLFVRSAVFRLMA